MEALKKKWDSCRGASILLALLFLLVCMMAGASILMAAASNAGKIKSNKDEQQKYLTLSSALNLVIDELAHAEYVGLYSYEQSGCVHATAWDDVTGEPIAFEHGKDRTYTQQAGKLTVTGGGSTWAGDKDSVLPLAADMDSIFSQTGNFRVPMNDQTPTDKYSYVPNSTGFAGSYTLELAVNDEEGQYGHLSDPVTINVELDETTGVITLTASLKDDPAYSNMEAVLNPTGNLSERLALSNSPAAATGNPTASVTWTLDHISKK